MDTSRLEIIRQCDPANTPIRPATHGMSVAWDCCLRRHTGTHCGIAPNAKHGMRMRTDDGSPDAGALLCAEQ